METYQCDLFPLPLFLNYIYIPKFHLTGIFFLHLSYLMFLFMHLPFLSRGFCNEDMQGLICGTCFGFRLCLFSL